MNRGTNVEQKELISLISRLYETANQQINSGKRVAAKHTYMELLVKYQDLVAQDIEEVHKKLAYECVNDVHARLNVPESSPLTEGSFRIMLAISAIVIILGAVFIAKPEFIGLATATVSSEVMNPISWTGPNKIEVNDVKTLDLGRLFEDSDGNNLDYWVEGTPRVKTLLRGQFLTVRSNGVDADSIKIGASRREDPSVTFEKTLILDFK